MVELKLEIPESFLEPEERCGYLVTAEMKEVWAVELDLYTEFTRVCSKRGLTFFASSGTALGAVRHGGFIPWDDDIDVMMARDQYDALMRCAGDFEHPYFLQVDDPGEGRFSGHAQLRNSETTGVLESELDFRRPYNQGIFMDIFPLDPISDNDAAALLHALRVKSLKMLAVKLKRHTTEYAARPHSPKARLAHPPLAALSRFVDWRDALAVMERERVRYAGKGTRRLANFSIDPLDLHARRDAADLTSAIMMPFEFIEVPVPVGYDHALTCLYGDYSQLVKGGSAHGGVVFDVDHPYGEWLDAFFGTASNDG